MDAIDVRPLLDGDVKESSMTLETEDAKCFYNCNENGGCSVRIQSSFPISGNTMGSCFSLAFGGECSGIPDRCENCLKICQGKDGQEFSTKAANP